MIETSPDQNEGSKSRKTKLTKESAKIQEKCQEFWDNNESVPSIVRYNLTISDEYKFIWFRNAKVGTRSIFAAFEQENISLIADSPSNCYYYPDFYKDYFKFSFVRNPWDRLVSGWLDKVVNSNLLNFEENKYKKMQDFESFITHYSKLDLNTCNRHFRFQHKLIDLNEIDYLGHMESFQDDLNKIFKHLGVSLKKVPSRNKSANRESYHSYYNHKTKDMVYNMYRKDIQIFGYSYD